MYNYISGLLHKHVPFRSYNYDYYRKLVPEEVQQPLPETIELTDPTEAIPTGDSKSTTDKKVQKKGQAARKSGKGNTTKSVDTEFSQKSNKNKPKT